MFLSNSVRISAASFLLLFSIQSQADGSSDLALRGIYNCGALIIGMTAHLSPVDSNKDFKGVYHFYPVATPAAKEGCFIVKGKLNQAATEAVISPQEWIVHPDGYGAADVKIDITSLGDGKAIGYVQHPSCSGPFEMKAVEDVESMPAECEKVRVAVAPSLKPEAVATAQVAKVPAKKLSALSFPTQVSMEDSCEAGQAAYRGKLLGYAANNYLIEGKQNYYNFATYMGYFSDDPVEREEIVDKVKPTIDADLKAAQALIRENEYFLLNYSEANDAKTKRGFLFGEGSYAIPRYVDVRYDWENNSAEFTVLGSRVVATGMEKHRFRIEVSAKEWRDRYSKYFGDARGKGRNSNLVATRSLVRFSQNQNGHGYFDTVFIELYDAKTGKSITRYSPTEVDINALAKVVPQVPISKVDRNRYGCKSLNKKYYKK